MPNYPDMDHSKYEYTRKGKDGEPWNTDIRHISILYRLSLALPLDSLIVEIGSWRGATATAYLEAMRWRPDLRLRLYETNIKKPLRHLIWKSGATIRNRVDLRGKAAWDDLVEPAALAYIDGDHGWPALADLATCLAAKCHVIAAHDTYLDWPVAHGSRLLGTLLRTAAGRHYYEDHETRPGERTDRGFIVSWPVGDSNWVLPALPRELTPENTNVPLECAK